MPKRSQRNRHAGRINAAKRRILEGPLLNGGKSAGVRSRRHVASDGRVYVVAGWAGRYIVHGTAVRDFEAERRGL